MKKFAKGILILAILIFVVGLGCVVAGVAMGVSVGDVEQFVKDTIPYLNEDFIESHEETLLEKDYPDGIPNSSLESEAMDGDIYKYSAELVKEIELDLTNVECKILPSDSEEILVQVEEDKNYVEVHLDEDSLEIECDPNVWDDKVTIHINLYIPDDIIFEEFYMTAGAGQVEIKTPVTAQETFMEMGAGQILCEELFTARKFELEVGAGSAEFSLIDADDIHVENAAGKTSMTLSGQEEMYNVTMEMAAGEIKYGNDSRSVYSGLAQGYSNRPKDAIRDIEIECSAGLVDISFDEEDVTA